MSHTFYVEAKVEEVKVSTFRYSLKVEASSSEEAEARVREVAGAETEDDIFAHFSVQNEILEGETEAVRVLEINGKETPQETPQSSPDGDEDIAVVAVDIWVGDSDEVAFIEDPSFYEESGTPVDAETGEDMRFVGRVYTLFGGNGKKVVVADNKEAEELYGF